MNSVDYDIKDYSQAELRRPLGLVLSGSFLYHGTVAVILRCTQKGLSQQDIEEAAKFVDAHDFIHQLPLTYDAPVTERAAFSESGQRQLLALLGQ